MRRDYFTLRVEGTNTVAEPPTVRIAYEGPTDELRRRLRTNDGGWVDASEIDVTYRFRETLDGDDEGVFAITNRITGEYILELNSPSDRLLELAAVANEREDGEFGFRIEIDADGERLVSFETSTFLVYDTDGELLRQHSLIPSGVEL